MDIRRFKAEDYPAIAAIHNSLNIVWPERPRTAEGWAEIDRNRPSRCRFQRWVALRGEQVVGFGSYANNNFDYHPQRFYVIIEVAPAYQRRGIGAELYDQLMVQLQSFDPRVLRADAFTNLPQGYPFLQKRGFSETFRETPVHLDTMTFDPSPYADLETNLLGKGIAIKTLREMESDPDRDHKLYDLYWEAAADVPQEEPGIARQEFENWIEWGVNDPTILADAYFIAVRGGEYIGLGELSIYSGADALLGGLLGVRRAYRKQGIGLAMQLHSIRYAREHGYAQLKTSTAVQNTPMQALFNQLGYTRDPEWLRCQKDIQPTGRL